MAEEKKTPIKLNPRGTILVSEGMERAAAEGIVISRNGLKAAAIRNGFISDEVATGKEKVLFKTVEFTKWLKNITKPLPESYITLADAAKELKLSASRVFALLKQNNIPTILHGVGGILYFDLSKLQKAMKKVAGGK